MDTAKSAIGTRLTEIYADRLLSARDAKEVADLTAKLTELLKVNPGASTPRVRLTLLEGDYNRAEAHALQWVGDPALAAARASALAELGRCRPELNQVRDELFKRIDRLNDDLARLDDGPRRDATERELQVVAQAASRATYFAAWANYYEALVTPPPAVVVELLRTAQRGFRYLLGVEAGAIKADEMQGLDAELTARIALGLALVEMAGGELETGKAIFARCRAERECRGAGLGRPLAGVGALAPRACVRRPRQRRSTAVDAMAPPLTPARGALCSMLIRGLPAAAAETEPFNPGAGGGAELVDRMTLLGLRGLIRLGRPDLARKLLAGRDLSRAGASGMLGQWLRGQLALHAAEAAGRGTATSGAGRDCVGDLPTLSLPPSRCYRPIAGLSRPGACFASASCRPPTTRSAARSMHSRPPARRRPMPSGWRF